MGVYYRDFGAVGDGKQDDFFAIKAAHDYANEHLLNVHSDKNATYYIGSANGTESITIKTNTYFHGCKFIFDDTVIDADSVGRRTSIFIIERDTPAVTYTDSDVKITSVKAGAENIGWKPGERAMIVLVDSNKRRYIRYGLNADNGSSQTEFIVVDADGNVDPTTPVQWDYDTVTKMTVYSINDRPIEINGFEGDKRTNIITWFNNGPSEYKYYSRNFTIRRSNVTLTGIEHSFDKYTPQHQGGSGCPYNGIFNVSSCSDVTIADNVLEAPPRYYLIKDGCITQNMMGTYEFGAQLANNLTYRSCTQSNFFDPDGSVYKYGLMGTNECKNLTFDKVCVTTFDAHRGLYNATLKDSVTAHISLIGMGVVRFEDVTVYMRDRSPDAIEFRLDYGSSWWGDVYIDGLTLKYPTTRPDKEKCAIMRYGFTNHNFGYKSSMAQNMTFRNIVAVEYAFGMEDGERWERVESCNAYGMRIFTAGADSVDDRSSDTLSGGVANLNPVTPPKSIKVYTEYTGKYAEIGIDNDLKFTIPSGPTYKDTKVIIDSTEYSYADAPIPTISAPKSK